MGERTSDLLADLARLAADLGPALRPVGHEELIASITAAAKQVFRAQACSIAIVDEEHDSLLFYVASSDVGSVVGRRVPLGQGIAGWVVATGQPLAVADLSADARFARDVAEETGYVPRSILAVPLETDRQVLGVIEVLDPGPDGTSPAGDLQLLTLFARQAALAMEASEVFTDLGRTLFEAAARAAQEGDLSTALWEMSQGRVEKTPGLAGLAACFNELQRLGPAERDAATELLRVYLAHARKRRDEP